MWEWRARPGEPRCLELDGNSFGARGRSVADGLTCETLGSNSKTWSNNEESFFFFGGGGSTAIMWVRQFAVVRMVWAQEAPESKGRSSGL